MKIERKLAHAIRILAVDATHKAGSGHPGMPMGMADIATVLWKNHMQHNPTNPKFYNRDRFILSNGHGSMLLYAILHLSGYPLTIEDLKSFRSLNSKTPGHPELDISSGIETTTGPLGQGFGNAVGMAIAEKHLASIFNRDEFNIVDHYTYTFMGDGCIMEGISHEAASLAGTLELGKLIVFYDDNNISIDGEVSGWLTDDSCKRFAAYNWQVIENVDGHDFDAIEKAIQSAKNNQHQPSFIQLKTTIGYGSPNYKGTAKTHGTPFSHEEIANIRKELNWQAEPFCIPKEIYQQWNQTQKGIELEQKWQSLFNTYQNRYPELAKEFLRRINCQLPDNWETTSQQLIQQINADMQNMPGRQASKNCLEFLSQQLPELMGGSADLSSSNLTKWQKAQNFTKETPRGNYINYGVREFGMSAIVNGLALHGGILPFAGTFLAFSDYARNAIRLSALMQQKSIFVYTHESIGLGEDGPTHQPIEQTASLRLIPHLNVWRPCDSVEVAQAWLSAINYQGPSALLFSKHPLNFQTRTTTQIANIQKGAYILHDCKSPHAILMATGYEVKLAMQAAKKLSDTIRIRVVSMPCIEIFRQQPQEYIESVLPGRITARVAIEAGSSTPWYEFVGNSGKIVGIDSFGKSAPYQDIYDYFGLTVDNIVKTILDIT